MTYEKLLKEADGQAVQVYERKMKSTIKGLYSDNIIWVNKTVPTSTEKACILAEELGHHHTSSGDILDQSSLSNRKQERRALNWAYQKLVPLSSIVAAHKLVIRNRNELAEYLQVTEEFLDSALNWYREKYGLYVVLEGYTVCLEPLGVLELFE
jgi:phosphoribosylanthranilate isomerase